MSRANAPTPFRDGFAALWHEPALLAAELMWRWCFGLSALILGVISIGLFLDGLKVSRADEFLLGTLQPQLLAAAFRHIFRGSLARLVLEQTLLLLGITFLWALAAAAGRAATLHRLVAMFRTDDVPEPQSLEWCFRPIFLLQLLRAMWMLIALAVALVFLTYGSVMAANEHPLAAALALSFGMGFAWLSAGTLNWYLGLAPLFCVRNNAGGREALEQTVQFSGRHGGRLFLLSFGFFLLRLMWAGMMAFALLAPVNFAGKIGDAWIALLMGLVALVYFAGVDLFKVARLGAYVSLAEDDGHLIPEPAILPEPLPPVEPMLGLA